MQRKALPRSFVRQVGVRDDNMEIEYTCPLEAFGNGQSEMLRIGKNGSRGRARTFNPTVNSRVLYH